MNIAIIPARGGSKRVKRKNIINIAGKPLISYSIKTALKSGVFDKVYVNSDDDEILSISLEYGAIPYKRPVDYAGDKIYIIDVVKEMIESLEMNKDSSIGVLLATSPLRNTEDICGAYNLFKKKNKKHSIVSVTTYETPIQLAQYKENDGCLQPVFSTEYSCSTRSTDHREVYKYNESIIFNNISNILRQDNLIGVKPFPYFMPPERSILIDYPYQLEMIRLILEDRKKNGS